MLLTVSVCASARLSVTDKLQIDSFLFLDGIEPFFGCKFSMTPSTKRCSSIFDLGPLTPKIYSPKFGLKSPISRLVWQIDRRCLHQPGGFRGWPIQWNHAKCCGTDPCCHGNDIWHRRGDPVVYRLVIIIIIMSVFWYKNRIKSMCTKDYYTPTALGMGGF